MAMYYVDTSAVVKRFVNERGTPWMQAFSVPPTIFFTASLTFVELMSTFNRRQRDGSIDSTVYADLMRDLTIQWATYTVIRLTNTILSKTRPLLERHPLRAADAIQLASALQANAPLVAAGLPPLTFLSADDRLLLAAHAEGLPIDNPLQHP